MVQRLHALFMLFAVLFFAWKLLMSKRCFDLKYFLKNIYSSTKDVFINVSFSNSLSLRSIMDRTNRQDYHNLLTLLM